MHKLQWVDINQLVNNIMLQVKASSVQYDVICGIKRGGLVPGVMLSHLLSLPFMSIDKDDRLPPNTLVVDEIFDTGSTIRQVLELNPHVDVAVLISKQPSTYVRYIGELLISDNWVVFPWEKQ